MVLKNLIEENNYPIVFIGAGISKRYLKNYMSWSDLLKDYWQRVFPNIDFYSRLYQIGLEKKDDQEDDDFYAYTTIAQEIEKEFSDSFYKGKIEVDGLDTKSAYEENISPFKFDLSNKFKKYDLRDDIDNTEFKNFKLMLKKAKIIITTNYDSFIEDIINEEKNENCDVYIGQNGFFEDTENISEIYKIHGSVTIPSSLVITKNDYIDYDKNSILISAKILISMIKSPIIFFGYSLTDRNIKKLLSDFSSQLPPEDTRKSADRIFLIQYSPNKTDLIERLENNSNLNFNLTIIDTDNFNEIYKIINKIDQGLSPQEIKKYDSYIKNIIQISGESGNLENVLAFESNLEELTAQNIGNKKIVVAMGDSAIQFLYPNYYKYMDDYFNETNSFQSDVALGFAAGYSNRKAKIPFSKYLNNFDRLTTKLDEHEIANLNKKIEMNGSLDNLINSINTDKKINSIIDFKNLSDSINDQTKINILIKNIKKIDIEELKDYIITESIPSFKDSKIKPKLRALYLAYDLLVYGDMKKIKKKS